MVDDASSTFGDPTLEIVQHIAKNHMDMCCFKGVTDGEYKKVDAAFSHIYKVKGRLRLALVLSFNLESTSDFCARN